jgi:hypothetical protein
MTYAMTLDNSWELMTEDEMYDVNGGVTWGANTVFGVPVGWVITISKAECADLAALSAIGAGGSTAVAAILSIPTAGTGTAIDGIIAGLLTMGSGFFWYYSNGNGLQIKTFGLTPVSFTRL